MWYAVSLGSGLIVGLALLIWGLRERGLRAAAETDALKATAAAADAVRALETERATLKREQEACAREQARSAELRQQLEVATRRLQTCNDPAAVKAWLDDELKKGTIG